MTLSPSDADLISLRDAAKSLPNRPHFATVFRWSTRGCRGRKLAVLRIGGRLFTSQRALAEFCSAGEPEQQQAPARRTNREREKAIREAERECELAGI